MHQDKSKPGKKLDDPLPNHPYALIGFGEALLLISLAMDGLTGAIQDKMNASHRTDTHTMMYNMNIWSCLYLFIGRLNACLKINKCFEIFLFNRYNVMFYEYLHDFCGICRYS
jgi:hypothetical protein